ncbi:MAG: polyphosphate:AMP phosphotransferase [Pseudomonadales bacterium]|nr:polyphosphate:AMP phosphotransferase [Pseudomonadales bacterium]
MFESAELGHKIGKSEYQADVPALREALLDVQFDLFETKRLTVLVLIAGVDGGGKGETVNLLNAWMDPRLIETTAYDTREPLDSDRPTFWRYWQNMPARGRIGIFFGSWYSDIIEERARCHLDAGDYDHRIQQIINFENMLARESTLILKYWFHLSKPEQKKRLEALSSSPQTAWRVSESDWHKLKHYDAYRSAAEHCLRLTSTGENPWIIIEGNDENYRNLTVGRHLQDTLKKTLASHKHQRRIVAPPLLTPVDQRSLLDNLSLDHALSKSDYQDQLGKLQGRLNKLLRDPRFLQHHALITVFEGNDAGGKGGSIRRITQALDARFYRIVPIAAPTPEESLHPYLWRFWRHLPQRGHLTIFDRSWYGRVLVERVEKFCTTADWMRAYDEINQFEHQLAASNIIVVKFWLAISKDEQLNRFKEREQTGFKRFKITAEDWRNREKWDDYTQAVNDMVDRTSTQTAPWTLVEANNKYHARIKILNILCDRVEHAITSHKTSDLKKSD